MNLQALFNKEADQIVIKEKEIGFDIKKTCSANGKKLTSFSAFSKFLTVEKFDLIPQDILEKAAERGKRLHEFKEMFDNFWLDSTGDIEGDKFIKHYAQTKKDHNIEIIENEFVMWNLENMTWGIADSVAYVNGELAVIDFKTVSTMDAEQKAITFMQLETYSQMLEAKIGKSVKSYILWFNKNAKYDTKLVELIEMPQEIRESTKIMVKCLNRATFEMVQLVNYVKNDDKTKNKKERGQL